MNIASLADGRASCGSSKVKAEAAKSRRTFVGRAKEQVIRAHETEQQRRKLAAAAKKKSGGGGAAGQTRKATKRLVSREEAIRREVEETVRKGL